MLPAVPPLAAAAQAPAAELAAELLADAEAELGVAEASEVALVEQEAAPALEAAAARQVAHLLQVSASAVVEAELHPWLAAVAEPAGPAAHPWQAAGALLHLSLGPIRGSHRELARGLPLLRRLKQEQAIARLWGREIGRASCRERV